MTAANPGPDLTAIKARQQAAWSSGDFSVIGPSAQIVAENLCQAVDLRSGWKVLDVAAGNGNASLAAARCHCQVTSTDYVPSLLARGKMRAQAEGYAIQFQEADAENLPFDDHSFDAVLSTFGVMFAPHQLRAASELLRVCTAGGKIGLANWTPTSFVGRIFKTIGKYAPPPSGMNSPFLWGTAAHLGELFGDAAKIHSTPRAFIFRFPSPRHFLDVFRAYYGPMQNTFAALDPSGQQLLAEDLLALMAVMNTATDGTLVLPGEYLEVVVVKNE